LPLDSPLVDVLFLSPDVIDSIARDRDRERERGGRSKWREGKAHTHGIGWPHTKYLASPQNIS